MGARRMQSRTHAYAEALVRILEAEKPIRDIEQELRIEIIGIERDLGLDGRLQVLLSFFGMVSMRNLCLLKVADACTFFPRLVRGSKFPIESLKWACMQEDAQRIGEILLQFEKNFPIKTD